MRVGVACDHGGFELKQFLIAALHTQGFELLDLGATALQPDDDYPDTVVPLARAVASGEVERGIAICGSGVGASIAANKIPGVRAGLCHDHYSAHQGVEHDAMNVLCLGARVIGHETAREIAETFLAAAFLGEDRHLRRLRKVEELE
jgi:ribose 5-phosphate isomerase B